MIPWVTYRLWKPAAAVQCSAVTHYRSKLGEIHHCVTQTEWDHTSNNARQCVLITALWYEHSVLIGLTTPLKFWLHRAYWHHFDKIWPLTSRWTKKHLAKHTHTENNTSYNFVTGEISTLKLDLSSTGKSWLLACAFCWCWHFGGMHIISLRYGIKIGKTNKTIVCCQLRDNR